MRVNIQDREALLAVSPNALSIYACQAGWHQHSTDRKNSDIYVSDGLPEIIVPRINKGIIYVSTHLFDGYLLRIHFTAHRSL